jgi:hypothetical protein
MKNAMLTEGPHGEIPPSMGKTTGTTITLGMTCLVTCMGLAGCVTLEAPDKPIEINLNINIKQEVVYRLDGEAKNLIKQEADIF